MSEFINNPERKKEKLLELALGMVEGNANSKFVEQFSEVIETATPRDVVYMVDGMVKTGRPIDELKKSVSKVINLMYLPLQQEESKSFEDIPFIQNMVLENREMEARMKHLKYYVKSINIKDINEDQLTQFKKEMLDRVRELEVFNSHYIRKENILFPHLEKVWPDYRCLQVMWSLHDDARKSIRDLIQTLQTDDMSLELFNAQTGSLFFSVYPLIYREENILFPVAIDELPPEWWSEMHSQSEEIGYAWIEPVKEKENTLGSEKTQSISGHGINTIDLGTGLLEVDQIISIFNHLPVDITFVNEKDEVRFFNCPEHRFFPRSKSIIGRKVQNCHPPESIDTVNQIVDAFKSGEKNSASFWIQMKGKFILIQYFAVRDKDKCYRGVVEVSQDISDIRKLEGERRLLDW